MKKPSTRLVALLAVSALLTLGACNKKPDNAAEAAGDSAMSSSSSGTAEPAPAIQPPVDPPVTAPPGGEDTSPSSPAP